MEVARIAGAYGVQGWVKVHPHSKDAQALLKARTWWLGPEKRSVDVLKSRPHSGSVVAELMGVANRELAQSWKGQEVLVRRADFPAPDNDEFYWVDLIGAKMENLAGEPLGEVVEMAEYGAHPVMMVKGEDGQERLIPFVDAVVRSVEQPEGRKVNRVVADWGLDY